MKLTTILFFLLIFSLSAVGIATLYNDVATDYGLEKTTIGDDYNYIEQLSVKTNNSYSTVKGSQASDSGSNFLVSLGTMWSAVKGLFNTAEFSQQTIGQASKDLGIPSIVGGTFIALLTVSLIVLLVSIAIRWKVD